MITVIIWYNEFGLIKYILTNSLTGLDYSIVEYVLPILILPIATILFGLKKKSGWILLSTYISYSAINVIGILFLTWGMEPTGIPAIDSLFPQSLIISLIITALFYGGTLWVLNKREVREKFNTNQNTAIGTIALTVVLTIFLISHSTNFN
jgi:drug/metabolite transporter (DMT)-like permease